MVGSDLVEGFEFELYGIPVIIKTDYNNGIIHLVKKETPKISHGKYDKETILNYLKDVSNNK